MAIETYLWNRIRMFILTDIGRIALSVTGLWQFTGHSAAKFLAMELKWTCRYGHECFEAANW
jgi:hypothetical protein